jgi:hypothetical protein
VVTTQSRNSNYKKKSKAPQWLAISIPTFLVLFLCCGGLIRMSQEVGKQEEQANEFVAGEIEDNEPDMTWQQSIEWHTKTFGEPSVWSHPTKANISVLYWNVTRTPDERRGTFDAILVIRAVDGSNRHIGKEATYLDYDRLQALLDETASVR